jgi:hypothetical protein
MVLATINKKHLPFSIAPDVKTQSGNLVRSIFSFLLIGGLGLMHYLLVLLTNTPALMAMLVIQLLALYILYKRYIRTPWVKLTL